MVPKLCHGLFGLAEKSVFIFIGYLKMGVGEVGSNGPPLDPTLLLKNLLYGLVENIAFLIIVGTYCMEMTILFNVK